MSDETLVVKVDGLREIKVTLHDQYRTVEVETSGASVTLHFLDLDDMIAGLAIANTAVHQLR